MPSTSTNVMNTKTRCETPVGNDVLPNEKETVYAGGLQLRAAPLKASVARYRSTRPGFRAL